MLLLATSVVYWSVLDPLAPAEAPPDPRDAPSSVKVQRGVVYGRGGDRDLRMDLYFSRRRQGVRKAIVFFHGGGWEKGDYRDRYPGVNYLARRGFLVASVEHRLSPEAPFPAALQDARCAVRFLRAKAKVLGIDGRSVGAFGYSSGGHIALLLALSGGHPELEGDGGWAAESSRVQAAVGISARVDLVPRPGRGLGPNVRRFLGGTPQEVPDVYALASPYTHVTADDPPVLLIHGGLDTNVPLYHPQLLHERMRALGLDVELIVLPDVGHDVGLVMSRVNRQMFEHFARHLGAPPGEGATGGHSRGGS